MKKMKVADLSLIWSETEEEVNFTLTRKGDLVDFQKMAKRLTETEEGKSFLILLSAMVEYSKNCNVKELNPS